MPKVTMGLTDRDVEIVEAIRAATSARSNAHAVSIALSLTDFLITAILGGSELRLRDADGTDSRVVMTELTSLRPVAPASVPAAPSSATPQEVHGMVQGAVQAAVGR